MSTKLGLAVSIEADPRVIEHHHDHPPSYENEILTALSCARAFETEAVWIMVNAGGPAEEKFIGGSGVWMPLKGRLAGMDEKEGMKVVDVDLNVLKVGMIVDMTR